MQQTPRLIVGLGNPGSEYAGTRHNIGFEVIDRFLASLPRPPGDPRHFADSYIWSCRYAGRQLLLQKPLTFMNLSGKAVGRLCREQDLVPAETLIVYDDVDLPLGRLRLRQNGGSGGHNGMASVIEELGTDQFNRLRIGIGQQNGGGMIDHVLGPFEADEEPIRDEVLLTACKAVGTIVRRGVAVAMNEFNRIHLTPSNEEDEDDHEETEDCVN